MPELGSYGSVRGAPGNWHPYREHPAARPRSVMERPPLARLRDATMYAYRGRRGSGRQTAKTALLTRTLALAQGQRPML